MLSKLKTLIALCFLALLTPGSHAQQIAQTDSLERVLKTADDTTKVLTYARLSRSYQANNPAKALQTAETGLALADRINFPRGSAFNLNSIGNYYYQVGNYGKAIEAHKKAMAIRRERNDKLGLSQSLLNIGNAYYGYGNIAEATKCYFEGLKYSEPLKNDDLSTMLYSNIAVIFSQQGNHKASIQYNEKVIVIRKKINDVENLAYSYNNLGVEYRELKNYDRALFYFNMSRDAASKAKNKNMVGYALTNIGVVLNKQQKAAESLKHLQQALALQREVADKEGISFALQSMAEAYFTSGNINSSLTYYKQMLELAEEVKNQQGLSDAYLGLTKVYERKKSYALALEAHKSYMATKDSLLNATSKKQLSELQTKYDTEKKEQQIQSLNQENTIQKLSISKRNITIGSIAGLFVISIAFAALFYNRYKMKQEAKLQTEIANQQNLATQAVLEAEEKERKRIGSDLHDSVGQLFAVVKMNLDGLVTRVPMPRDEDRSLAERTRALVDESCKEVRSIAHQLMPNALLKAGLASGIRDFINKIDEENLTVNLDAKGLNDRLDGKIEMVLYRVIQETVNNVIKHSQAKRLDIQLAHEGHQVKAVVSDNGKGFDSQELENFEGIGLKNIKARVQYLKGTVDFQSQPGLGTTITIRIPLEDA